MTSLDWGIVLIVGFSALLAFWRGAAREVAALAAWIAGIVFGLSFSDSVAAMLPDMKWGSPAKQVIAFLIILVGVLILGSILGRLVSKFFRAAGLGLLDRLLGGLFGVRAASCWC